MQEMGLEPTHCHQRQILSLMRLPFRHSCAYLLILQAFSSSYQIRNFPNPVHLQMV